jgi:uncharacterized protein
MNRLQTFMPLIVQLCESHKVQNLYAFGSVLTDKFHSESDIDLIVDFGAMPVEDYADNYFDFKFSLQDILQRKIDLLEDKAIKNPYFRNTVNAQKQLVYAL